ncbi:MAG: response regulator [FCB group bacterium]|nr:response regulator [FCB group bacterium]
MTNPSEKKILVVDDESDVRRFLSMALEDAGFNVVAASDGFEALEKVKESVPDLISLDLVMPKRSGAKFYHDLQQNKQWSKIPIIIVTGHARDELGKTDMEELTMSGPGIYLEKPVKPDNYVAAVRKMLGMPTEEVEPDFSSVQNELKELIDEADPEVLQKLMNALKQAKKNS